MEFSHLTQLTRNELLSEWHKIKDQYYFWENGCEAEGLPNLNMAPYEDSPASNAWDNFEEARIYLEAIEEEFASRNEALKRILGGK